LTDDSIKHSSETAYRLETPEQHRTFYDDWAKSYDSGFATSKGYDYPKLIAEYFVGRVSPDQSSVLDIGCGTGLVGVSLRKEGWSSELTGVDISEGMLGGGGKEKGL
jgi:Predicted methyltransferase (contains TPR repeat)